MTTGVIDEALGTDTPDPGDVVLRAIDWKTYGATEALKGVNFEARRGKVTVLFGENGAGKSTLMKILAGIEQPTSGNLELDGERCSSTPSTRRAPGIAIIHQELNLCANLSVRDNMFLGHELRTRRRGRLRREIDDRQASAGSTRGADLPETLVGICGSASSRSSRSPGHWPRTRGS